VVELAESYDVSRKTIYDIAEKGKQVLVAGMAPGPHGPHQAEKLVKVDRNRLVRGSVVLTEVGVSQRDVTKCLGELLDTEASPSWVNGELAQIEEEAANWHEAYGADSARVVTLSGRPALVMRYLRPLELQDGGAAFRGLNQKLASLAWQSPPELVTIPAG